MQVSWERHEICNKIVLFRLITLSFSSSRRSGRLLDDGPVLRGWPRHPWRQTPRGSVERHQLRRWVGSDHGSSNRWWGKRDATWTNCNPQFCIPTLNITRAEKKRLDFSFLSFYWRWISEGPYQRGGQPTHNVQAKWSCFFWLLGGRGWVSPSAMTMTGHGNRALLAARSGNRRISILLRNDNCFSGFLYDKFRTYDIVFQFASGLFLANTIMFFVTYAVRFYQEPFPDPLSLPANEAYDEPFPDEAPRRRTSGESPPPAPNISPWTLYTTHPRLILVNHPPPQSWVEEISTFQNLPPPPPAL